MKKTKEKPKSIKPELKISITTLEFPVSKTIKHLQSLTLTTSIFQTSLIPTPKGSSTSSTSIRKGLCTNTNTVEKLPKHLIVKHDPNKRLSWVSSSRSKSSIGSGSSTNVSSTTSKSSLPELPKCPNMGRLDSIKNDTELLSYMDSLKQYQESVLSMETIEEAISVSKCCC